jgi:dsDNA-specific endonuclease/ATPase MutS2
MEHFKSKLEEAIHTHTRKIVFIHGVGNGVLKMEIRKELDRRAKKLTYQDASFKEYGYGATLVQIK